jgi:hypothetical protein
MKNVPIPKSAYAKPVAAVYDRRWALGERRHLAAQTKSNHCDLIQLLLLGLGFSYLHKTLFRPGDNGFNLGKIIYRKVFKISRNKTQLTLVEPTKGGGGGEILLSSLPDWQAGDIPSRIIANLSRQKIYY